MNEKRTEMIDGIVRVTRPQPDLWSLDLSTTGGLKLTASSRRIDARDALLALADSLAGHGPGGAEPYRIDRLTRTE